MPPKAKPADAAPPVDNPPPVADPDAPDADPTVSMADVAALNATPAAEPEKPAGPKPFLSEGMRHDLERIGWAVDPSSGARFELDAESGEVTVTERTPGV